MGRRGEEAECEGRGGVKNKKTSLHPETRLFSTSHVAGSCDSNNTWKKKRIIKRNRSTELLLSVMTLCLLYC